MSSSGSTAGPPPGPPYAPIVWQFGGLPEINPDVAICAVYLFLYTIGAIFHMTVFQINKKHGAFFVMSTMTFGFCMCRITTFSLRLGWAFHERNVSLGIASNIFVAAGTPILYIINLIFAHRIVRSQHPKLGWHKSVSIISRVIIVAIIIMLVLLIYAGIHQSFTLNPTIHQFARDVQRIGTIFYSFIAFLPIPIVLAARAIPRQIRPEKFGAGRFRTKYAIIITSSLLLTLRAVWGAVTTNLPPVPRTELSPWYYTKPAFYTVQLLTELMVVGLYAFVRVDKRFIVPNKARGSYLHLPLASPIKIGVEKSQQEDSSVALVPQPPMPLHHIDKSPWSSVAPSARSSYTPIRVYNEEELFNDASTLADTLRLSRTSMVVDDATGKWQVRLVGDAESIYTEYENGGMGMESRAETSAGEASKRNSGRSTFSRGGTSGGESKRASGVENSRWSLSRGGPSRPSTGKLTKARPNRSKSSKEDFKDVDIERGYTSPVQNTSAEPNRTETSPVENGIGKQRDSGLGRNSGLSVVDVGRAF